MIDRGKLKMAFVNEKTKDGWRTIDPERGVYLVGAGGHEKCRFFKLHVEGYVIPFEATYKVEKSTDNSTNITWVVERASVPTELQKKNKEIRDILSQILDAHGFGFQRSDIKEVIISIPDTIPSLRI